MKDCLHVENNTESLILENNEFASQLPNPITESTIASSTTQTVNKENVSLGWEKLNRKQSTAGALFCCTTKADNQIFIENRIK